MQNCCAEERGFDSEGETGSQRSCTLHPQSVLITLGDNVEPWMTRGCGGQRAGEQAEGSAEGSLGALPGALQEPVGQE